MKNMKKTLVSVTIALLLLLPSMLVFANDEPSDAPIIEGTKVCIIGIMYTYTVTLKEPDDCFLIFWGDETDYRAGPYESGVPIDIEHVWAETGTFAVRAISANQEGHVSNFSEYIYVVVDTTPTDAISDIAPKTPPMVEGQAILDVGEVGTYSTSTQHVSGDPLTYVFSWGDGNTDMGGPFPSGEVAILTHSWNSPGTYSIQAMAISAFGTPSLWSETFYVEIIDSEPDGNSPPEVPSMVSGESMCNVGETQIYTASTTDPDGDDIYYIFFWGTNTHDGDILGPYASGETAVAEHIWDEAGIFDVVVLASDGENIADPSTPLFVHVFPEEDENNPPESLLIRGETACMIGETYIYEVFARDPEVDDLYYKVYWGDGGIDLLGPVDSAELGRFEHTWETIGTYWITISATDQNGACTTLNHALCIYVSDSEPSENTPPTIPSQIYGVSTCTVGDLIGYETTSYDIDGDELTYVFYWGDGSTSTITSPESQTVMKMHRWDYPGIFSVRATACDGVNPETGYSPELIIHVLPVEEDDDNEAPNKPYLSGRVNCIVGDSCVYSTRSADPDNDDIYYHFSWGDGTTSIEGPSDSGMYASTEHIWESEGTYVVSVIAKDTDGHSSVPSDELLVTAVEPVEDDNTAPTTPTISGPTDDIRIGETVSYEISSTDPDGDSIYFEYKMYDSSYRVLQEGMHGPYTATTTFTLITAWDVSGRNHITVSATDEHGYQSEYETLFVDVDGSSPPSEPDVWCSQGHEARTKQNLKFSFDSTDPDRDNIRYYIDWGDGHTETTNWLIYGDEYVTLYHSYWSPNVYEVKARATDANGMEGDWSDVWYVVVTKEESKSFISFLEYFPMLQWVYDLINRLF